MKDLLEELKATKLVKVTGSFADGTFNDESDIDFYVMPDHPDKPFSDRNILKIISVVEKFGLKCRSTIPGYIFTHLTSGNGKLERQLEFSDLFKPRKNRQPEVEIYGVSFKTF